MSYTFQGATQLNKDLNTWNVKKVAKKVASMIAIINDAANFDQPPNSWNVVRWPAWSQCLIKPATSTLSQIYWMSACWFCCPNSDILCRVGDMSPTCFGHVSDMTRCPVGQGVQNNTTCRLFPTCRLNVEFCDMKFSSNILNSIHWLNIVFWSYTLMIRSHCWRCSSTLYIYKEDLIWVWTEWGVSIISTNRGSKCITFRSMRAYIRLELHPYDP